jgi:hypothetical protein
MRIREILCLTAEAATMISSEVSVIGVMQFSTAEDPEQFLYTPSRAVVYEQATALNQLSMAFEKPLTGISTEKPAMTVSTLKSFLKQNSFLVPLKWEFDLHLVAFLMAKFSYCLSYPDFLYFPNCWYYCSQSCFQTS